MSIYAGLAAGWGEGLGQRNAKMMDYFTKKSETLAKLYEGLASNIIQSGGDQTIASEFINRAKGWGTANPLFDPKGYQKLLKSEKAGIHDIIDSATKRRMTTDAGFQPRPSTPTTGSTEGFQPRESSAVPLGGQKVGETSAPNFDEMFTQQGTGQPPAQVPGVSQPQSTQTSQAPQGPNPNALFETPNIEEMIQQMTGGAPMYGAMGAPTAIGKMVQATIPAVLQKRMEMQQRMDMVNQLFDTLAGGADRRSPSGSSALSSLMRAGSLNWPVTQWRLIDRALYVDPDTGEYNVGPVNESFRDQSKWISPGPGLPEREVKLIDSNVKVTQAPDGSLWAETTKGPIRLGSSKIPVQLGNSNETAPTPGGGQVSKQRKVFSQGSSADVTPAVEPMPDGSPTVGTSLPPGVNPAASQGPPTTRTSNPMPSTAYKGYGSKSTGTFSLEKLETSLNPTDRQIAAYITHPENFTASGNRREMWNYEFARATNGAVTQAPTPLSEFGANFEKQRNKIVAGFHASKNISNILNSTDGVLVGMIAGRWTEFMNQVGSSKGLGMAYGDRVPPSVDSIKSIFPELLKDRPYLNNKLTTNGDQLAAKAADLITTMRLFNFADVVNTIGGVQGVSSIYKELKQAMLNPGMDLPLILGHLSALNRNMTEGLLVLEKARWGPKIPYIREKELLGELYWDPHVEGLISKYQAAAAAKGTNLSRQDAVFLLWRNGKIEADPGNRVEVERLPAKQE